MNVQLPDPLVESSTDPIRSYVERCEADDKAARVAFLALPTPEAYKRAIRAAELLLSARLHESGVDCPACEDGEIVLGETHATFSGPREVVTEECGLCDGYGDVLPDARAEWMENNL